MKTTIEISFIESEQSPAWALLQVLKQWKGIATTQFEAEKKHVLEMRAQFPGYAGDSDDYQEMANAQLCEIDQLIARIDYLVRDPDGLQAQVDQAEYDDPEELNWFYATVRSEIE